MNTLTKCSQLGIISLACFVSATIATTHASPPNVQPLVQGKWPGWKGGQAFDVQVVGNHAYMGIGEVGLTVFDVNDPRNPVQVGGYESTGYFVHVAVAGNFAYMAGYQTNPTDLKLVATLQVIDVSNPTNCVRVGRLYIQDTTSQFTDVTVADDHAYVVDTSFGLTVINVSDPTNPVRVGNLAISGDAQNIAVSGHHAYVALGNAGLAVIDITNPATPVLVGNYPGANAADVAVSGSYAYVADYDAGLQIIDVSDPFNCVRRGGIATGGLALGVAASGNYAYVAHSLSGLEVIDVSDPTNCTRVGGFDTTGQAYGVTISGNYAYVADYDAGLQVIDVSDPTSPVRVSGYDTSGLAYSVAISGKYAYVADDNSGLQVIDVADPANPVLLGGYNVGLYRAEGVAVSGTHAYVTNLFGLNVIDVSDPTNCVLLAGYPTAGSSYEVALDTNRVYVADGEGGLLVRSMIGNVDLRIEATPNEPFTLEATTTLSNPNSWQPLLATNVATMPFYFVDFDVKLTEKPHKFYRVRQP